MKKISYTKVIVFVGVFIALDILLTRPFRLINAPFNLSFVVMSIASAILGPFLGGLTAYLSDLTGVILFPQGQYFVGYAITAVMRASIYGLFFYKKTRYFVPISSETGLITKANKILANIKTISKITICSFLIFVLNIFSIPFWDMLYVGMFIKKTPFVTVLNTVDIAIYWTKLVTKIIPYGIQFGVQIFVMYLVFRYMDIVIKKYEM